MPSRSQASLGPCAERLARIAKRRCLTTGHSEGEFRHHESRAAVIERSVPKATQNWSRPGSCRMMAVPNQRNKLTLSRKISVVNLMMNGDQPESSQSLLLCTDDEDEDTEARREIAWDSTSFFIILEAVEPEMLLDCLRDLFPVRSSSKRSGRGRKCVRSYRPHLLQTILPGLSVERLQLGGSVWEQLKHRRRRYCVSLEAASSVCWTGSPA
jgi:hypothetical protein